MEPTAEQKAALETEEKRQRELDARIVAGVTAGLKPVIEKLSEREQPAPAQVRTESVATIQRPSEELIAQAQIDGNTTELARLLKIQRAADQQERQRELASLANEGGAAISSVAQTTALQDPSYKKYQKEVDAEIAKFRASNPNAILTPEHYRIATRIVRSEHTDQEISEGIEEQRRQAREKEDALLPDNSHHEERQEKEPTTLKEALDVPDWKLYKEKHGKFGRSDEEELRKMGYKNGLSDFLAKRKENAKLEDELGSGMGLDRDWDKAKGEWVN